jgi:NAD(P)H-dependent FMN reductase
VIRFLTISGSLRDRSSNSLLLDVLTPLAPPGVRLTRYAGLAGLPQFNPDHDVEPAPESVRVLREAIASADGLIVSSPEYAHGVPGALKNALDWLVSGVEIYGKPVALFNPAPMSLFAHPQLAETLRVMNAMVVEEACITLPIAGHGLDAAAIVADPALAAALQGALDALAQRARGSTRTASRA